MSAADPAAARTLNDLLLRLDAGSAAGLRLLDRRERAERLSWAELAERAAVVAGRLRAAGVAEGDRVALVFPTGREFFEALFGVLLAGAVPAPLYPPVLMGRLGGYHRRTAAMLRASAARLVLAERRVHRLLGDSVAPAAPELGCRELSELPPGKPTAARPAAEDLGLVQFSSGTTVAPKPVALSHRALLAQVLALNSFWPDDGEGRHRGVSWLPLYHDMGLIGCVLPALERQADLTLIPPELFVARPAVWLRAISRYRATISPAPNFAYALCVDRIRDQELEGVDLSSWRVALNGAEAVAPEVLRRFAGRFGRWGFRAVALTPVYGLAEAALAVTFSDLERPFLARRFDRRALGERGRAVPAEDGVELTAVGRPLPGFRLSVRDEEGGELPPGRLGRLWVRGPSLMSGYLGQPEATAAVLQDGWLDTGDRGFLHDGQLYLVGRAKDLIIVRGRNHAPEEIEQPIGRVAGVRTGAAAALSHLPEGGAREQVVLLVERRRRARRRELDGIEQRCRDAVLAAAGVALDRIEVLPPGSLPRTSSGKIRRQEALRRLLDGRLGAPEPVALGPPARAGAPRHRTSRHGG